MRKRSVRLDGHATSVALENVFWNALDDLARRRGCSTSALIAQIDRARTAPLASTLRVMILSEALHGAQEGGLAS
ncbi:MAG: ribbon-helix-helix domain-containing protein [Alphaproteobacteria bacterium]|nr:MAG: ribbon-helix-helix domain-containing protein [Alphaproteobacteria bacterium]